MSTHGVGVVISLPHVKSQDHHRTMRMRTSSREAEEVDPI